MREALDSQRFAAFGAAASQNVAATFGAHAGQETVNGFVDPCFGLIGTFGHFSFPPCIGRAYGHPTPILLFKPNSGIISYSFTKVKPYSWENPCVFALAYNPKIRDSTRCDIPVEKLSPHFVKIGTFLSLFFEKNMLYWYQAKGICG